MASNWAGAVWCVDHHLSWTAALRTNASVRYAFDASVSITVEIIDLYLYLYFIWVPGPA